MEWRFYLALSIISRTTTAVNCCRMVKEWKALDKVFLITGGASGLGAAYTEAFLNEGAKHIFILDIAEDKGRDTENRLNNLYDRKVTFVLCDICKEDQVIGVFNHILGLFTQIDVIINNAGMLTDAPQHWQVACITNLQGVVSLTLKGIECMRKDNRGTGGTIINISATLALTKGPFFPIYGAAKLAVLHFSQCISMNPFYDQTGIRILTMCPGATNTSLLQGLENKTYDMKLGKIFGNNSQDQVAPTLQKVESAVAALLHMFKHGSPGSIWLTNDDKPAKDITLLVDRGFNMFEKEILFQD